MFNKPQTHDFKASLRIVVATLFLAASGASIAEEAVETATAEDIAIARGFIRCETFYKHYYESLRTSNPSALSIPAIAKLPTAIQVQRIAAESLIGETMAKSMYGKNLESQLLEFTAAASGSNWANYAKQMSHECSKLSADNNNERMNGRIQRYMDLKGIKSPLQPQEK